MTSLTSRARIKALASRSQSTIVLNDAGRSATFKGRSVLHRPGDPDWDAVKGWFYAALVGTDQRPDDPVAQQAERILFIKGDHETTAIIQIQYQAEAGKAMLFGAFDYRVLHNVACIYAELSAFDTGQSRARRHRHGAGPARARLSLSKRKRPPIPPGPSQRSQVGIVSDPQ